MASIFPTDTVINLTGDFIGRVTDNLPMILGVFAAIWGIGFVLALLNPAGLGHGEFRSKYTGKRYKY